MFINREAKSFLRRRSDHKPFTKNVIPSEIL